MTRNNTTGKLDHYFVRSEQFQRGPISPQKGEDTSERLRYTNRGDQHPSSQSTYRQPHTNSIIYQLGTLPTSNNPSFGLPSQQLTRQPVTFTSIVNNNMPSQPQTHPITTQYVTPNTVGHTQYHVPQHIMIGAHAPIIRPVVIQREHSQATKSEIEQVQILNAKIHKVLDEYEHVYHLYQNELKNRQLNQDRPTVVPEESEVQSQFKHKERRETTRSSTTKYLNTAFSEFQSLFSGSIDDIVSNRIRDGLAQNQRISSSSASVQIRYD